MNNEINKEINIKYKNKYLKYKNKYYNKLKSQKGGSPYVIGALGGIVGTILGLLGYKYGLNMNPPICDDIIDCQEDKLEEMKNINK